MIVPSMSTYLKYLMTKFTRIDKDQYLAASNLFHFSNRDQLRKLDILLVSLIRHWFSEKQGSKKIDRVLNIRFGYFHGYKLSNAITELLNLILLYQPTLIISHSGHAFVSNNEKNITELVFPPFNSNQAVLKTARIFVPESETVNLVKKAKNVNFLLTQCCDIET